MTRTEPSANDLHLTAALAELGLQVTPYQLERWRAMGLVPRSQRHGLGRGRGSVASLPEDALDCARTVVQATRGRQGLDVRREVVAHFCRMASRADGRLEKMAEWTVRSALIAFMERFRVPRMTEDDAYQVAMSKVIVDPYIGSHPLGYQVPGYDEDNAVRRRKLQVMRSAYQHILAAEMTGTEAVGDDLLEESVAVLGWATSESASILVAYLNTTLQRTDEHIAILRSVPYARLLEVSKLASGLMYAAAVVPDQLHDTYFSWVPTTRSEYMHDLLLSMAFLMKDQMRMEAEALMSDNTLQTAVRKSRNNVRQ